MQERRKDLADKLENGLKELYASDKYADYLKTMSRFHRYSSRNTLLIHMQMPGASRVAGASKWKSDFKRHPKKGEKALYIYAPVKNGKDEKKLMEKIDPQTGAPMLDKDGKIIMEEMTALGPEMRFRPAPVFDVSQTAGKPLPEIVSPLNGDVERYESLLDALRAVSPLPIGFEEMPEAQDGYCQFGEKIGIRKGMSERQTVAAIVHEITHARLHDKEKIPEGQSKKSRAVRELEAESVAFAICEKYGIDSGANSFGYLAEWAGHDPEMKQLKASLDTIQKEVSNLSRELDGHYAVALKKRGIEAEQPQQEQPVNGQEKQYRLGFGYIGNANSPDGIEVWNWLDEKPEGGYVIVANISAGREVTFVDENMPDSIKNEIMDKAKTAAMEPEQPGQAQESKSEKKAANTKGIDKICAKARKYITENGLFLAFAVNDIKDYQSLRYAAQDVEARNSAHPTMGRNHIDFMYDLLRQAEPFQNESSLAGQEKAAEEAATHAGEYEKALHDIGEEQLEPPVPFGEMQEDTPAFQVLPAEGLPNGWRWREWDDGSGSLQSPDGESIVSYDLSTSEYKYKGEWSFMAGYPAGAESFEDFKVSMEKRIRNDYGIDKTALPNEQEKPESKPLVIGSHVVTVPEAVIKGYGDNLISGYGRITRLEKGDFSDGNARYLVDFGVKGAHIVSENDLRVESVLGYEITGMQPMPRNNDQGVVIGHNPNIPDSPYVTWMFTERDGERSYYTSRYHQNEDSARTDLRERAENATWVSTKQQYETEPQPYAIGSYVVTGTAALLAGHGKITGLADDDYPGSTEHFIVDFGNAGTCTVHKDEMSLEIVQGYEIKHRIEESDKEGVVLAHSPTAPDPYVTWRYIDRDGERDYWGGQYRQSEETALSELHQRLETGNSNIHISPPEAAAPPPEPTMSTFPLYKEILAHAVDYGETETYNQSRQFNFRCRDTIDKAITDNVITIEGAPAGVCSYDMKAAVWSVIGECGRDRAEWVLAANINGAVAVNDRRISDENRAWAQNIGAPERHDYHIQAHKTVLDGFARRFRESEKEKPPMSFLYAQAQQRQKASEAQKPGDAPEQAGQKKTEER